MSTSEVAIGDVEASAAVGTRDGILSALLADSSALLLERTDEQATVRLAAGESIVLISCPPGAPASELHARFDRAVHRATAAVVHVVAIGGGRLMARALKKAAPFWQLRRKFGFHQVDELGDVKRVAGRRLTALAPAVARAASSPLPTEDDIAAALAHGRQHHADEARLDSAMQARFPWVTIALAAACIALFALGLLWSDGNISLALYRMGANSGEAVKAGEIWRVLASAFLHANVGHLAVNMIALASFGPLLERLLGPRRYILLYGLSGLGAGLASALLRGPGVSVGASGAIWGLMAAGVGLALWPRGLLPLLRLDQARRRATFPLVINIAYSFSPGVDLWAHFGGGLVGFALMATGLITRGVDPLWTDHATALPPPHRRGSALTIAAVMISVVLAASVTVALGVGRPWELGDPPVLGRIPVGDTGLTIELPSVLARIPHENREGTLRAFTYGDFKQTPCVVEIVLNMLPQAIPPEQLDEVLIADQKALQDSVPPGAQRTQPAAIVTVGNRRFASVTHMIDRVTMKSWASVLRDRDVLVRVYSTPDLPLAWAGLDERIVASLQLP